MGLMIVVEPVAADVVVIQLVEAALVVAVVDGADVEGVAPVAVMVVAGAVVVETNVRQERPVAPLHDYLLPPAKGDPSETKQFE